MKLKWRRGIVVVLSLAVLGFIIIESAPPETWQSPTAPVAQAPASSSKASEALDSLEVKGRAPKTGYSRDQFGSGWASVKGCDTRNIILYRDLINTVLDEECNVLSGTLQDVYTGKTIEFSKSDGAAIQIDHVVALSDSWQKGAQFLSREMRVQLANDPLELIAVDGPANQQKGDGDAATWLPSNKGFRCQYIARQIAVKRKYTLWVTEAEKKAMQDVLSACPEQGMPVAS